MADSARQRPTYPQFSAPGTFLHSRHKEANYVTCRQPPLQWRLFYVFPPGLRLFKNYLFYFLKHFLISGDSLLFFLEELYIYWEKLLHRGEEGLASIQLLSRTSCCCNCWAEVKGQSQSPVHEYTQAKTVKEQGWEVLTSAGISA